VDGARRLRAYVRCEARHDLLGQPTGMQRSRSHAPGFARGHVATGQGQGAQMADARAVGAIDQQHFTAPGSAVRAQAHAIQRDADHRARRVAFLDVSCAMFGQHRRDMGVVVLHGNGADPLFVRQPQGQVGAEEVRVQVVGHGVDASAFLRQQCAHGLLQCLAGCGVGQVAMLRGPQRPERRLCVEQTGGVFQERAAGQDACHVF
jgi:hypothetical protein